MRPIFRAHAALTVALAVLLLPFGSLAQAEMRVFGLDGWTTTTRRRAKLDLKSKNALPAPRHRLKGDGPPDACRRVIQARMGSTRFPGKVLADLGDGRSLLAHVIERAQAIRGIDGDRYREAAREIGADTIIRITADCPFLDPALATRVLAAYCGERLRMPDVHYTSNVEPVRSFPDGLGVEVVSAALLEATWLGATAPEEREHVTLGMRMVARRMLRQAEDRGHWRWTIDVPSDLDWARQVQRALPPEAFTLADTVAAIRASGAGFRVTGDEKV